MQHAHLRKDKICLNCGATVQERFCSHCGQENTEPRESFRHLIGHFFADVTHYDAQVFTTVKDLIVKPGYLTGQYNSGKRVSYLNPIRMYIFISAVFFIVAFSLKSEPENQNNVKGNNQAVNRYRQHLADSLRNIVKATRASAGNDSLRNTVFAGLAAELDSPKNTKNGEALGAHISNHGILSFQITEDKYPDVRHYEAAQLKMTGPAKDGWVGRYVHRKIIRLTHERSNDDLNIDHDMAHDIPKLMFVLLPLFALIMRFFYNRKKYLYAQHAIFSLHFHSFMFLVFLLASLLNLVYDNDTFWIWTAGISLLLNFIYLAVALHNVYGQPLWLSFIKSTAISVIYSFLLVICLVIFVAASFILL